MKTDAEVQEFVGQIREIVDCEKITISCAVYESEADSNKHMVELQLEPTIPGVKATGKLKMEYEYNNPGEPANLIEHFQEGSEPRQALDRIVNGMKERIANKEQMNQPDGAEGVEAEIEEEKEKDSDWEDTEWDDDFEELKDEVKRLRTVAERAIARLGALEEFFVVEKRLPKLSDFPKIVRAADDYLPEVRRSIDECEPHPDEDEQISFRNVIEAIERMSAGQQHDIGPKKAKRYELNRDADTDDDCDCNACTAGRIVLKTVEEAGFKGKVELGEIVEDGKIVGHEIILSNANLVTRVQCITPDDADQSFADMVKPEFDLAGRVKNAIDELKKAPESN